MAHRDVLFVSWTCDRERDRLIAYVLRDNYERSLVVDSYLLSNILTVGFVCWQLLVT